MTTRVSAVHPQSRPEESRASGVLPGIPGGAASPGSWWGAGAALAAAAALGAWIAQDPAFLHLEGPFTLGTLLSLAVALGGAAMILRRPGAGVLLLVGAVYLNLSQVLVRHHGLPSFLQLLAVPLLVAAVMERCGWNTAGGRTVVSRGHLLLLGLMAAYVLAVLLSTTVATDRALADERFVEVLKGLALVVLLLLLVTSRARMRGVAWVLLGSGALLAALAVVQTATGDFSQDFWGLARVKDAHIHGSVFQPRVAGPLGDPNYFAQILLVLVPIALFMAWEETTRRRRILAFAAAGLIAAGTVLSYSRGGALALGAVVLVSFLVVGMNVRRLATGVLVLMAAIYLLPQDFAQRVATVSEILPGQEEEILVVEDSSFQERMLLAGVAWEMFRDHPVLGVGAGNYTVHFDDYVDRVSSAARDYGGADEARYPHNLYLELGAEGGMVALLSFFAVMGGTLALLLRARGRFQAVGDPLLAALAVALAIGLCGYLLSSLFLHGHFQRYLWLLVGLAAALHGLAPRSESGAAGPAARTHAPPTDGARLPLPSPGPEERGNGSPR